MPGALLGSSEGGRDIHALSLMILSVFGRQGYCKGSWMLVMLCLLGSTRSKIEGRQAKAKTGAQKYLLTQTHSPRPNIPDPNAPDPTIPDPNILDPDIPDLPPRNPLI